MKKELPQRKQTYLKGFDYSSTDHVFFITLCTVNKRPYFSDPKIVKLITDELEFRQVNDEIKLYCYCIMPDHIHLLLSLTESYIKGKEPLKVRTLQNWVSAFKRYTSRISGQMYGIRPLWQTNFFDHVVRKDESLIEICSYILNNPVRKGMVSRWEDYPYSKIVTDLPI